MATLLILDGFGIGKADKKSNAIYKNSPYFDKLINEYPSAKLIASGEDVGLSFGQMGNSETGHLNIGAGRIVYQNLSRIDNLIKNDELKNNPVLKDIENFVKQTGGEVHLFGLLSDGGVHSHINHLKYLIKSLSNADCKLVLHCFLDGRDTKYNSGINYLKEIENYIQENKINCQIADMIGRVYAMDRERRFDRIKLAYNMLVGNDGEYEITDNLKKSLENSYKNGIFDEFVKPTKLKNSSSIKNGDAILSFNFRTDRVREIVSTFGQKDFKEFEINHFDNLFISTMTNYDQTFDFAKVIIPEIEIKNCLSEVLSKNKKKQFRVTETTKYAHITFFFNGEIEKPFLDEERVLIESINTTDFSKFPKMRAKEITNRAISAILSRKYDFVLINLSNADMLGHTGNIKATKKAIKYLDHCIKKISEASLSVDEDLIITADHGNAELMSDENGDKITSHTTNLVPITLVSKKYKNCILNDGRLADISPTILNLLNIDKPREMTGKSLIEKQARNFYVSPSTDPVSPESEKYEENLINYAKLMQDSGADFLHCDIMDGNFVERKTFEYPFLKEINSNTTIPLDVHLMTNFTLAEVKDSVKFGANILTLHIENFIKNNKLNIKKIKKIKKITQKNDCLFGLAIKPKTDINYLIKILPIMDLILIMSVEPGKSGQKFLENSYKKIQILSEMRRNNNFNYLIEVDGGVNPEIAQKLRLLGVDIVVSGNYIFNSENKVQTINSFK